MNWLSAEFEIAGAVLAGIAAAGAALSDLPLEADTSDKVESRNRDRQAYSSSFLPVIKHDFIPTVPAVIDGVILDANDMAGESENIGTIRE